MASNNDSQTELTKANSDLVEDENKFETKEELLFVNCLSDPATLAMAVGYGALTYLIYLGVSCLDLADFTVREYPAFLCQAFHQIFTIPLSAYIIFFSGWNCSLTIVAVLTFLAFSSFPFSSSTPSSLRLILSHSCS